MNILPSPANFATWPSQQRATLQNLLGSNGPADELVTIVALATDVEL